MSKILLHLGTREDGDYQHKLAGLAPGVGASWKSKLDTPVTITDLENTINRIPGGIAGIVCTNEDFLKKLLYQQADFIPPTHKRGVTLEDYQGSLLHTARDNIPVVVLQPLSNLVSVPWAVPAAKRFISKLTKPESFYPQTPFTWEVATPSTLPAIYDHWLQEARLISCDIETAVGDPLRRINCVGYCAWFPKTGTSSCIVIPFDSPFMLEWVKKFNQLPQPKIFQNGLYDNLYFLRWNCPVYNWLHDTQHLFHSMWTEYPKRLDFITAYAIRNTRYWKDDGKTGNLVDYYRYNARDCWATLNSYLSLISLIEPYAVKNYLQEFPLVFPCITCEADGLKWNKETATRVRAEKETSVLKRETAFVKMIAAPGFNLNSWQQVAKLFKVLGCGSLESTGKADMMRAQAAHPLNNRILSELVEIKADKKLLSNYFATEKFWNDRVYYRINPAGTDTWRLASTESSFWCGVNIQQTPRGDSVKQCIESDPGWLLCEIDKAQSEARCVGYLSGDTKLIDLVEGEHDYHSWNASSFFGVPYQTIYDDKLKKTLNKQLRDLAKRTNHGANYNMGANVMLATMGPKLVAQAKLVLKLPSSWSLRQVCQYMLDVYSKTYPRVKGLWYDSIIKEISVTGKLVSPLGQTRIFFGSPSKSNKPALNAAVAHPAQNLSVGIVNREFYNIWRAQVYNSYFKDGVEISCPLRDKVRIKAQIHDSNFFQYRAEYPELPKVVAGIMNSSAVITGADGVSRTMFIPNDISAGKVRWSDLK